MSKIGFIKSLYDCCVYVNNKSYDSVVYLLLHVDYMLIRSKSKEAIKHVKSSLKREFDMKDLGNSRKILGIDIDRYRSKRTLSISQDNYCNKVLNKFNMENSKVVSVPLAQHFKLSTENSPKEDEHDHFRYMANIPYSQVVGSLMYLMVSTRPDLSYVASLVSRYMTNPGKRHWEATKWILRYLKGSKSVNLTYCKRDDYPTKIYGYVDSDYAGDLDKRRSLSGYIFFFNGNAISWKAKLQSVVALSESIKEGLWLKGLLSSFGIEQGSIKIYCDNQSAIHLSKNQQFHNRTKHIDIKHHFVRDQIEKGYIEILKVHTSLNAADMLTKFVPKKKFEFCLKLEEFMLPEKG